MYLILNIKVLLFFQIITVAEVSQQIVDNYIKYITKYLLQKVAVFRADGQRDRHNASNNPFPQYFVWFQLEIKYLENFRKYTKYCFNFYGEGHTERGRGRERGTDVKNLTVEFRNFLTKFQMCFSSTEDVRNFWPS